MLGAAPSMSAAPSLICSIRKVVSSHRSTCQLKPSLLCWRVSFFRARLMLHSCWPLWVCTLNGWLLVLADFTGSSYLLCLTGQEMVTTTLFLHLYRDIYACTNVGRWISEILIDKQTPRFYCWSPISRSWSTSRDPAAKPLEVWLHSHLWLIHTLHPDWGGEY